jgi:hypothetical protein
MRKRWMSLAAAVGLAVVAGSVGPARAIERGGKAATTLVTITTDLQQGDQYSMVCGFADFPRTAFLMVTDDFASSDGGADFKGVARYSGDAGALRVTGKVSKFRFEHHPPEDHPPYPGVFGSFGVAPADGALTKSLAIWTVPGSCSFTVNGVERELTVLDSALARIIDLAEFDGGVSAAIDPVITAGALQHQDQTSNGHLTAILDVSSSTGSSALLRVAGPEGQRYESLSFDPFVWVDAPSTSGQWTYEVTGVQSSPQFPVLWTLEVPGAVSS